MQNISFPILVFTPDTNIDASGNLKIEIQNRIVDVPKKQSQETLPATLGLLLALSIMAGATISAVFLILTPILLLILFSLAVKPKIPSSQAHLYAKLGQKIVFDKDTIYIKAPAAEDKRTFLHTEIKEISLYFIGITPKNAKTASQMSLISKGRTFQYHFWIDSEDSKQQLINALRYLYKKEISIKEYSNGPKSYLLQTGASPKIETQIQSLIDEIGTKEDKNNAQML